MTEQYTFTILTQNLLLDKTRQDKGEILPQYQRIPAITDGIQRLPFRPDLIGVQEVHRTERHDSGQLLVDALGYSSSYFYQHNQKRPRKWYEPKSPRTGRANEHIGLIGDDFDSLEVIELGDNRRALLTEIGGVAFVALHLRAGASPKKSVLRAKQSARLVEVVSGYENAVLFGDFNEYPAPFIAKGRSKFASEGFVSVFDAVNLPPPLTYPIGAYKELYGKSRDYALDDILTRGKRIKILTAGVLAHVAMETQNLDLQLEPTDHNGVWAKLEVLLA